MKIMDYVDVSAPRHRFRSWLVSLASGWWYLAIGALLAGVAAALVSLAQDPIYEASATLYVTAGADANAQAAYQGSLASQQRVASYARLVTSDAVLNRALVASGLPMSIDEVRSKLGSSATPDTVLLDVTARDSDPNRASLLANSVAQAMVSYVAALEAPADGGSSLAKVTVVSPATAGGPAVSPKTGQNVAIAFVVGAVIGLAVRVVRDRFDTKIRSEDDVVEVLPYAVLGRIPQAQELSDDVVLDSRGLHGVSSEAFRKLRTNLAFANVDSPIHSLLITSGSSGDGKTSTVIGLASVIANSGKSVVVVDGDLRKPSVARRLGLSGVVGLSDVLVGSVELGSALQASIVPGMDVLVAGQSVPNPADLLGSSSTEALLDELSRMYEFIIIDSAPLTFVTDAAVISRMVDASVMVVRFGRTSKPVAARACAELGTAGGSLAGTILNDVPAGYGYGYGYGYGSDEVSRVLRVEGGG